MKPGESQSWWDVNRESLLTICEQFGIDPSTLPKHGPLDENNWGKYMRDITGFAPCEICNGPVSRQFVEGNKYKAFIDQRKTDFKTINRWEIPKCMSYPVHSLIVSLRSSGHNEDKILGKICPHGLYLIECFECTTKKLDSKEV